MASSIYQLTSVFDEIDAAIRDTFDGLIIIVNQRRDELLAELGSYKVQYLESERIRLEKIQDLANLIEQLNNAQIIHENAQSMQKEFLDNAQVELEKLQLPSLINVQKFDTDDLETLINDIKAFGGINPPPYSDKVSPILEFGPKGRHPGELRLPLGVDVDSDSVYVADMCNGRIQVFGMDGSFKSKFGWGKLEKPHGIAVNENFIFVSDSGFNEIQKYEDLLANNIFNRNGQELKERYKYIGQSCEVLDFPLGIAVDDESVYVADCNSNRIAVFDLNLRYVTEIGKGMLKNPRDVEIHGEKLFVVDYSTPFHVHIFLKDGTHLNSFINLKGGDASLFMCIDTMDNILISDGASSTIQVFDRDGKLLHVIPAKQPSGIAVHHYYGIVCSRKFGKKQMTLY